MTNSIDFYKVIFLHVIPVHIIVPCIQRAPVPARAHRGRVCTRVRASVRGFTGAGRDVSGNRVRVCGGRRGHTGQGNVKQRNGTGKADDWKWESVDIGDHVDQENFAFAENEGRKVRIKDNSQPVDFVELYLTETIVEVVVRETICREFHEGIP